MISSKERRSALRRMAGNIASGLITTPGYQMPYDLDSVQYDRTLERVVVTALRIAEDIYAEIDQRVTLEEDGVEAGS